jgi:hypothetical protein
VAIAGRSGKTMRRKRVGVGASEVIFHKCVAWIHRGTLLWCASTAKVVNLYSNRNIEGKEIIGTVQVIIKESPSIIMVKS